MQPPGSHDLGGVRGYGTIEREANEPPFHHEWEARVFVLNRVLLERGIYNLDEFRFAVERIPADRYAAMTYYERWYAAIETMLREKGVLA